MADTAKCDDADFYIFLMKDKVLFRLPFYRFGRYSRYSPCQKSAANLLAAMPMPVSLILSEFCHVAMFYRYSPAGGVYFTNVGYYLLYYKQQPFLIRQHSAVYIFVI